MLTGEGDEILIANESAGFWADDEEDVWATAKPRGDVFMSNDGLTSDRAAKDVAGLFGVGCGDDRRVKGKGTSDDLLGVNGAAIVLIDVRAELVVLGEHGG